MGSMSREKLTSRVDGGGTSGTSAARIAVLASVATSPETTPRSGVAGPGGLEMESGECMSRQYASPVVRCPSVQRRDVWNRSAESKIQQVASFRAEGCPASRSFSVFSLRTYGYPSHPRETLGSTQRSPRRLSRHSAGAAWVAEVEKVDRPSAMAVPGAYDETVGTRVCGSMQQPVPMSITMAPCCDPFSHSC